MAEVITNPTPSSIPNFSVVITEMHQIFKEKKIGAILEDHTSSWTEAKSVRKTASVLTPFTSSSAPEVRLPVQRPNQTIHVLTPTMVPISAATIQHALRNLRPVQHPEDFPAVTSRSCLLSPVTSPLTSPRATKRVTSDQIPPFRPAPSAIPPSPVSHGVLTDQVSPFDPAMAPTPSTRTPKSVTKDQIPIFSPAPSPRALKSVATDQAPSPRFSIRSSKSSITSDDSEILNSSFDVLRSIRRSRELTRSVAAYLRSISVDVEPPPEQEYAPTSESQYEFYQPYLEQDINSIRPGEGHEPTQEERATPQPSDVTTQRVESFNSGDRSRVTPTILEQIIEAKKNLKPVHGNADQRHCNVVEISNEEHSELQKDQSKKKKKSRKFRLLCCFRSPQVDE
ncbi:hypothetical protein LOTGIDRAFT_163889 [Lottia gigantea]|uniref:Uncharacterized protein n=1 Tax=Lottia gigantea TaxID=225164 RepID=V4BP09_LOTGI|nr:hypothetical protein LOTGIDRAFT_163889 [Lottia gigantea]ESO90669.1 hypothetical protein LOTGIDRAFT_163889 [Lottia gigantea]